MQQENPHYEFSAEKNQQLIEGRGVSFEDVIVSLDSGNLLDIVTHHNKEKYPAQNIYIVDINGYVYLVPFVKKDKRTVFLKTIFPSRKFTKTYLDKVGV